MTENRMDQTSESSWLQWWTILQSNKGGRAELARCSQITDAAFCRAFHLLRQMRGNPTNDRDMSQLALISIVLANVKENNTNAGSLAYQMSGSNTGERALVSEVRFRQLLRYDLLDFNDRLLGTTRIVRQLGRVASVHKLAEDLWWWNDKTKRDWAVRYFEVPVTSK